MDRVKVALLSDKPESSSNVNNNDRQSDHLLMMVAYEKWVKILHEVCDKRASLAVPCSSKFVRYIWIFLLVLKTETTRF